jgi:hypothetical protein
LTAAGGRRAGPPWYPTADGPCVRAMAIMYGWRGCFDDSALDELHAEASGPKGPEEPREPTAECGRADDQRGSCAIGLIRRTPRQHRSLVCCDPSPQRHRCPFRNHALQAHRYPRVLLEAALPRRPERLTCPENGRLVSSETSQCRPRSRSRRNVETRCSSEAAPPQGLDGGYPKTLSLGFTCWRKRQE